jgi:hypothetical protein
MQITINHVDMGSMQCIGTNQAPSYPIHFTCAMVSGIARFVPSHDDVQRYIGNRCDVEINHERISDFEKVTSCELPDAIIAQPDSNAFFVRGTITSLIPLDDPIGNTLVTVSAGDAALTLSAEEHGVTGLSLADRVQFRAYDVSLWDEAI